MSKSINDIAVELSLDSYELSTLKKLIKANDGKISVAIIRAHISRGYGYCDRIVEELVKNNLAAKSVEGEALKQLEIRERGWNKNTNNADLSGIISDDVIKQAIDLVISCGKASVGLIQRRLNLTYEDAMIVINKLEQLGVISEYDGKKPSRVYPDKILNSENINADYAFSIFITGQTGSGKSYLAKKLLFNTAKAHSKEEVKFVIFDLKSVEFTREGEDYPAGYLFMPIISDVHEGFVALRHLIELAQERARSGDKYPAIVIYIEECDMAMYDESLFHSLLNSLIINADSANFCIIYSTSKPSEVAINFRTLELFEKVLVGKSFEDLSVRFGIDQRQIPSKTFLTINRLPAPHTPNAVPSREFSEELVDEAIETIRRTGIASTASLQKELKLNYGVSARIIELLEQRKIIGTIKSNTPREIFLDITPESMPDTVNTYFEVMELSISIMEFFKKEVRFKTINHDRALGKIQEIFYVLNNVAYKVNLLY
ncbi:MAG: DNA translocase FtsK [Candidatus Saccharimonadales bacterium]